jgi:hypothetical protein
MSDSEHNYQRANASLLAEERKLIELLSANPLLLEIQEARERVLERIENDDSTIIQRELTLSFAINTVLTGYNNLKLVLSQIRDQDRRCVPLRDEWYALLNLRNEKPD